VGQSVTNLYFSFLYFLLFFSYKILISLTFAHLCLLFGSLVIARVLILVQELYRYTRNLLALLEETNEFPLSFYVYNSGQIMFMEWQVNS
jgi:hypothetical protein